MKLRITFQFLLGVVVFIGFLGVKRVYVQAEQPFKPTAGKKYAVKRLLTWIQEYQGKQAGFFILTKDGQPVTLTRLKNFTVDVTSELVNGSAPVSMVVKQIRENVSGALVAPTMSWAEENENKVVLHQASKLIDFLDKQDCFDAAHQGKDSYAQLLLYFEVQASNGEFYPFFLVDPLPGKRQELGGGNVVYPVGIILSKFGQKR